MTLFPLSSYLLLMLHVIKPAHKTINDIEVQLIKCSLLQIVDCYKRSDREQESFHEYTLTHCTSHLNDIISLPFIEKSFIRNQFKNL